MSQKLSQQQLEQITAGVNDDVFRQFYVPIFFKTASDLGLPITSDDDLTNLLEIAYATRPTEVQKTAAQASPYAAIAAKAAGKGSAESAKIASYAAQASSSWVQQMLANADFQKLATISAQLADAVQRW